MQKTFYYLPFYFCISMIIFQNLGFFSYFTRAALPQVTLHNYTLHTANG